MKTKKVMLIFAMICGFGGLLSAQFIQTVSLDNAIMESAREIEERLDQGVKAVVLNFNSPSPRLSDYIINELTGALVNGRRLTMVDRQNLALIQEELSFQMSGEVSDESMQEIGNKLGAQSIISGSIENLGNFYRIRFRVIEVVSAAIQLQPSKNVRKDNHIGALMRDAPGGAFGDGLSFSAGQKTGYSFLNLLYGTGSFLMGDISGGLWVGGMELTGTVLIIVGIVNIGGATTTSGYYYYGNYYSESYVDSGKLTAGYIMLGVGALLEIGGAIYGFIRPSSYDRTLSGRQGTYNSFNGNPIRNIDIGVLPDDRGIRKLNLTWSSSF